MPIDLDRRTMLNGDAHPLSADTFFTSNFVALAERNGHLVAGGMRFLDARPLSLTVEGAAWTIVRRDDAIAAIAGVQEDALHLHLTGAQFSDWAQNQQSFNGMMVARALSFDPVHLRDVSIWDALTHTLLDGWPAADTGLQFLDRDGATLDLSATFTPDDDPHDIAHFLREAGYLHLRGWLDPSDMPAIIADMDRALPTYVEGDGKSWWATLADGARVCVRLQEFVEHSPTTARILSSERWAQLRRTLAAGDELVQDPVEGRIIEALLKPIGVVSGPSDVTFHRDCHLGRHMYDCSGTTIGIALTATDEANGQLRVIAGSHRVVVPVEIAKSAPYLPRIGISTEPGDLTVHLSCTLHEATPPITSERRVMYTGFSLPARDRSGAGSDALRKIREQVTNILRDETIHSPD